MIFEAAIASVERLDNRDALSDALHAIVQDYGFNSFCFLDISDIYKRYFLYFGSTGPRWENEYQSNGFAEVDEVIKVGKRSNRPFTWSQVPLPDRLGKKKSAALKVFDASRDYHFQDGYVIPFHFVDSFGRYHSALCSLFWTGSRIDFARTCDLHGGRLQIILTYWIQRVVDLVETGDRSVPMNIMDLRRLALKLKLTDRERDVLSWAARGKTSQDTASILKLSDDTIATYIKAAIDKLSAGNKTHAVAKALHLGLIDI